MNSPNDKFQVTFDSVYAYPPQIRPVFDQLALKMSQFLDRTGALTETQFPRGIFVTLIPCPEEEEKPRRLKSDNQNRCLWVYLRVSGDELWDYAEKNDMEFVAKRILTKIVDAVCAKYKLDSRQVLPW
ncbi:MAG TPA: hypothetical protein PK671_09805 [Candidatus Obscuribacter sp.]|nr:hypothetical protein [Candidatus Obscuribacter sp.]